MVFIIANGLNPKVLFATAASSNRYHLGWLLKEILCVRLIIYTQASSNKMSNDITPKRIVDFCIPSFSLNSTRLADNIFICVMLDYDYFIIWTLHTEAKPSHCTFGCKKMRDNSSLICVDGKKLV